MNSEGFGGIERMVTSSIAVGGSTAAATAAVAACSIATCGMRRECARAAAARARPFQASASERAASGSRVQAARPRPCRCRSHDRDADRCRRGFVEGRADDDVGVLVDLLADAGGGLVDLEQVRSLPPVIEMRTPLAPFIEESSISGLEIASSAAATARPFPGFLARPHHRLAHLAHDRADVGEVEIDQAFLDHQVGDAGDARIEHLIGHGEGVGEGGLFVRDPGTGSGSGSRAGCRHASAAR
jgi:hypothetical protein